MSDERIHESFKRCEASGDFAERFYSIFLKTSPEIGDLFADTDFKKQRVLLRASVFMLVTRDVAEPKAKEALQRIGISHSKANLDIRPELYETWLDSLCLTVQQMDPEWTEELETAWRDKMRPGIELITSLY